MAGQKFIKLKTGTTLWYYKIKCSRLFINSLVELRKRKFQFCHFPFLFSLAIWPFHLIHFYLAVLSRAPDFRALRKSTAINFANLFSPFLASQHIRSVGHGPLKGDSSDGMAAARFESIQINLKRPYDATSTPNRRLMNWTQRPQ